MRILRRVILMALASGALTPAAALATPTPSSPPTVATVPEVGVPLTCNSGTWTTTSGGSVYDTYFTWYRDTTGEPVFESTGPESTYTPVTADLGHQLLCEEHVKDSGDESEASALSDPSAVVAPMPSVTITQYSPVVSGNIGESLAGVTVKLALHRSTGTSTPPSEVAKASVVSSADGSWTATLTPTNPTSGPPNAFGATGDLLSTEYMPPSGSPAAPVPLDLTFSENGSLAPNGALFQGGYSTISATGDEISDNSFSEPECVALSFIINGTSHASTAAGNEPCGYEPSPNVTDAARVQTAYTEQFTHESVANLTTISEVGLTGVGAVGAPTCTGDLVTGQVLCENLNSSSFAVRLNGGAQADMHTVPVFSGSTVYEGSAVLPGLAPEDTVTLDETSPTVTTRHLTTLHIYDLRVDLDQDGNVSGSCQPNKPFGSEGPLCPSSGTFLASLGGSTSLFDDLSGGATLVNVPTLFDLVPSQNTSIADGAFTAYADLEGIGSSAQTLASTQSVNLQIVPRGSSAPVFDQDMTPESDSLGPFEKLGVSGLGEGEYIADWLLTDAHGDTSAFTDTFVVQPTGTGPTGKEGAQGKEGAPGPAGQPGDAGPQRSPGPQGPAGQQGAAGPGGTLGPQGPAGKDGTSSLAKCVTKVTGKGTHKHTKLVCTVSVLAPGAKIATVRVSLGHKTVAVGTATLHRGAARLTLHNLQALRRGRYLVTLVSGTGKRTSVTRTWLNV